MNSSNSSILKISSLISKTAQTENAENFKMIPISKLVIGLEHPFKLHSEEELRGLAESIREIGVQQAIVVRETRDECYEVLAGRNRIKAAELAGLLEIPGRVMNVDDDTAKLIITDTNLKQREKISFSDKARAYQMQLEVFKNQGKRTDILDIVEGENNLWSNRPQVKSRDKVAEMNHTSAKQISRYIRLNYLITELLEKVDSEEIQFTPAVELSYLSKELQRKINSIIEIKDTPIITTEIAETLRNMKEEELLSMSQLDLKSFMKNGNTDLNLKKQSTKYVPFKSAFKAVEKQFKKIDTSILTKMDEEKLQKIITISIQEYLDELQ